MKKSLLTAVLFTCTIIAASYVTPTIAQAQTGQTPPAAEAQNGSNFADHKAKILERISDRIANMQKRQSCVQAATSMQALRACMPERDGQGAAAATARH